jgi:glycosyltransferase involved in cell wall biosynthesis
MARGKAIVATETDGAKQLLKDCGKIVPINDAVKMAEAVVGLLENDAEIERLGRAASIAAGEKFSLSRMISETEAVYQKVIDG